MAKYGVGQKVVVVDDGKVCPTYYDWASNNNLSMSDKIRTLWIKYLSRDYNDCEKGAFLTIVAVGEHGVFRNTTMYLCEDGDENPVLIEESGIDVLVEKPSLKWADLKVGDVLRKKITEFGGGYRIAMVTIIDTFNTSKHVKVGENWLTDEELARWEKVED